MTTIQLVYGIQTGIRGYQEGTAFQAPGEFDAFVAASLAAIRRRKAVLARPRKTQRKSNEAIRKAA